MAFSDYFSLVAFFIFLRETIEASVIIAVLLQCMNRTTPRVKKWVWWGAGCGIALSVVFGGIFAVVYYALKTVLFQGAAKAIFQGVICYVAAVLITWLGFVMLRFSNIEQKWARKLDAASRKRGAAAAARLAAGGAEAEAELGGAGHRWSIFLLAFTAVLREGVEAVIFLAGVGANTGIASIPLACLAGLAVGLAAGFAIYYGGRSIKDLRIFFVLSTAVLFLIAAGQVSIGTQVLSTAGAWGPYSTWEEDLSWQYRPLSDWSACCSDLPTAKNPFFPLLRAVFGYSSKPTPVVTIAYCLYWAGVLLAVGLKWRNGSLFDADYKRKRALRKLEAGARAARRALARSDRRAARLEGGGSSSGAELDAERARRAGLVDAVAAADAEVAAEEARLGAEDEAALRRMGMLADDAGSGDGGEGTSEGSNDLVVGVKNNKKANNKSKDVELGTAVAAPPPDTKDVDALPELDGPVPAATPRGGFDAWLSRVARRHH